MNNLPLDREVVTFSRYLSGLSATPYVVERYATAHGVVRGLEPSTGHDRWLLQVARTGTLGCRLADAWARIATPAGPLRVKLVVLLAILEVTPPFADEIDRPVHGPAREWAGLVVAGTASVLALLAGAMIFMPVWLLAGRRREAP